LAFLFPLAGQEFNLDRFSFSLTPKVLEHGTQQDFSFGVFYTQEKDFAGQIRLRYTKEAENEDLWGISNSLVANDSMSFEGFLLPLDYHPVKNDLFDLMGGLGLYYDYSSLKQKGYFNDALYGGLNEYTNDFSVQVIGPLAEGAVRLRQEYFYGSLSLGVVPVFFLQRDQTMKISPLMDPKASYTISRGTAGSPYVYTELDLGLTTRYVSLFFTVHYAFTRLQYHAIGFDGAGQWDSVEETLLTHDLKFEVSLLIPLGKTQGKELMNIQLGYGRGYSRIEQDAADPIENQENYILLGVKKFWF
jgi:hypothetical protein